MDFDRLMMRTWTIFIIIFLVALVVSCLLYAGGGYIIIRVLNNLGLW